jgi:hypothetical protein
MEKTKVRIKLKGQFYGKVGTIVKRVNQYSFGVKFDDIRGVHPFGHRNLEIVDAPMMDLSIQNKFAFGIKQKIEAKLKECESVNTSESIVLAKFCKDLLNGN